jgi:hypothetical protein
MADKRFIVAWWGAILSTIVFLWDIYKWRTAGPKLRLRVQTGMEIRNAPEHEGKTLLVIEVVNYGERPTTITNAILVSYSSALSRLRKRHDEVFVIPIPSREQPLPFELKPGSIWRGMGVQEQGLEDAARDGYLYCLVAHSHRGAPLKRRVRFAAAHRKALDSRTALKTLPP